MKTKNLNLKQKIKDRFDIALIDGGAEYLDAIEIGKRIFKRQIKHGELREVIEILEELGYNEVEINGDFRYSIYDIKAHYECGCSWEHCCL